MFPAEAFLSFVGVLEWLSVAVFAVTGALAASRKEMDIVGFALLGTVTGIGGGTVRDILLGRLPVFWVTEPAYVIVCVLVSALVFFTAHLTQSRLKWLLWLDALGLALVAAIGAERGLAAGAGPTVAIVMGMITGVFGGMIRDMLAAESPLILRKEIYITAAFVAAAVFVGMSGLGIGRPVALMSAVLTGFVLRVLAIQYGWSMPAYRARPGRSIDEIK